ncbi:MAG TPA: ABC transporter substrate-binding protein [Candidatus Dormibacteraeota bacterium]|nr:ABC transporter substrate-binding protein [Candidatus Dormibacteraeota bacterium]
MAQGTAPGVSGKEVSLGAWTPESGLASVLLGISQGADAYFRWVDDHGGVKGYRFKFIMANDQYNPALTPAAARRLVEVDKVFAIVTAVGTPSNVAALSYLSRVGIPNVAPLTGDPALTHPVRKNIFTVMPDYVTEGAFQTQFALKQLHSKSLAVIYQNDGLGKSGLDGVLKELAQRGLKAATTVPYDLGTVSFTPMVARLKASGADTVIVWGSVPPFVPILKAAQSLDYHPNWIAYVFDAAPAVLNQIPPDELRNAYFDSWVPLPSDAAMVAYRKAMTKYYPQINSGSLLPVTGWCLASVFASAFSDMVAGGAAPSWSGLETALDGMHNFSNTYVHDLSFSTADHQGKPAEFVMKYQGGGFVKVTPYLPLPTLR